MLFQCIQFFIHHWVLPELMQTPLKNRKISIRYPLKRLMKLNFQLITLEIADYFAWHVIYQRMGLIKTLSSRWNHSIKNDRAISFWNTIYHAINLSQCVAVRESFAKNFFFVKSWFFFSSPSQWIPFCWKKIVCVVCLFLFCFAWFNRIHI